MNKKKIFIALMSGIILCSAFILIKSASSATELLFSTTSVNVKSGESFDLEISIDPRGEKNYTTIIELRFPSDLLEIDEFNYSPDTIVVNQPGYDQIDNQLGKMVKTVGFPGGTESRQKVGTVKFKTKKEGQGTIMVGSGSIALDKNNKDIFSRSFPEVKIVSEKAGEEIAPENIFDIKFDINLAELENVKDLTSRVRIQNFRNIPSPIYLSYKIIDTNNISRYSSEDYLLVDKKEDIERKYENIKLPIGNYSLVLRTTYSNNVEKKFERAFSIIEPEEKRKINWVKPVLVISGAIIVFMIFIYFLKKNIKKTKNEKM